VAGVIFGVADLKSGKKRRRSTLPHHGPTCQSDLHHSPRNEPPCHIMDLPATSWTYLPHHGPTCQSDLHHSPRNEPPWRKKKREGKRGSSFLGVAQPQSALGGITCNTFRQVKTTPAKCTPLDAKLFYGCCEWCLLCTGVVWKVLRCPSIS